jgi:hypothetical protein
LEAHALRHDIPSEEPPLKTDCSAYCKNRASAKSLRGFDRVLQTAAGPLDVHEQIARFDVEEDHLEELSVVEDLGYCAEVWMRGCDGVESDFAEFPFVVEFSVDKVFFAGYPASCAESHQEVEVA